MTYCGFEIVSTNYAHPMKTTGQHTNGPAMFWVRHETTWYCIGVRHRHAVVKMIDEWNKGSDVSFGEWFKRRGESK